MKTFQILFLKPELPWHKSRYVLSADNDKLILKCIFCCLATKQCLTFCDPLSTHSSIIVWRIPWTEEPSPWDPKESDMNEWLSLSLSHGLWPTRLPCSWNFLGKSTGVGCHFLLQEISLIYGSNVSCVSNGNLSSCPRSWRMESMNYTLLVASKLDL